MRTRSIRQVVANVITVIAVLGVVFGAVAACGSPERTRPAGVPRPPPGMPGVLAAGGTLGAAGQAAAGIAALGGLGEARGSAENVRDLAARFATNGQAILDRLRTGAEDAPAAEPATEQRAALADLRARTGAQFDQAWLRTAEQMQQRMRDAAKAVLADENASAAAKAIAAEALSRFDRLADRLRRAAAPAGVGTPRTVDAGSGGQTAGDVTPTALVLVGVGAVLLAGTLWWRCRAA